ncbi:hypothetical protein LL912_11215 [Niabella sp. CC-SYL272]|uniref:hypothetical protein n=1 Tax=Niabella agricola TaxID=2891571 RepID=UPI001F1F0F67|nr:hypothetical protein [Niabella agricola]MCF3109346.1 hypothetical protein [Niabella agricola]
MLLLTGALVECQSKPVKNAFLQLPRNRMEMVADSVYRHDTRNLHRFAVFCQDARYWSAFEVNLDFSTDTAYQ